VQPCLTPDERRIRAKPLSFSSMTPSLRLFVSSLLSRHVSLLGLDFSFPIGHFHSSAPPPLETPPPPLFTVVTTASTLLLPLDNSSLLTRCHRGCLEHYTPFRYLVAVVDTTPLLSDDNLSLELSTYLRVAILSIPLRKGGPVERSTTTASKQACRVYAYGLTSLYL
jgi:hypothetical protein